MNQMSKILNQQGHIYQNDPKVTMRRVVDTNEFAKLMDFTQRIKTPNKGNSHR
jgi:hypothetical protein